MKIQNSPKLDKKMLANLQIIIVIFLSIILKTYQDVNGFGECQYGESVITDFGNIYHSKPTAMCQAYKDVGVQHIIASMTLGDNSTTMTYAIRGSGTTTQGETLTNDDGVIIDMTTVKGMSFNTTAKIPYVDVYAGELWENVVNESLKLGFAPKSLPDYLKVTVGGTISTGGIGGQTFKHGPLISSVLQLDVITGNLEKITCSEEEHRELFHFILGGLGQFAVIIKARIALEKAPKRVKWATMLYEDFEMLQCDQEYLISKNNKFDSIVGFISNIEKLGNESYYLEVGLYYNAKDDTKVIKRFEKIADELNYRDGHLEIKDVSYEEFLNRRSAVKQPKWDNVHPWINLLVPKSNIRTFVEAVFGSRINYRPFGYHPIGITAFNRNKWSQETSLATPDEEIFYLVSISSTSTRSDEAIKWHLSKHQEILKFCKDKRLGVKQYIPHYQSKEEWRDHFGKKKWSRFLLEKSTRDYLKILNPGVNIFRHENHY